MFQLFSWIQTATYGCIRLMSTVEIKTRSVKKAASSVKRCGLYVRVSTDYQVDRQSLSVQKSLLTDYVKNRKWHVEKMFVDAGLSAKNTDRPALQEMLQWAKAGKLDIIVVHKIDRVSRNLIDLLTLIEDLKKWNVHFVSTSQSFDTSTPMGMLMLNILGSFAQFEREMTADRVRESMLQRARKGVWSGGQPPYGYAIGKDKQLKIESKEAKVIKQIYEDFLQNKSIRRTCYCLNATGQYNRQGKAWSLTSIRRILSSPTYAGTLCYSKRTNRGDNLIQKRKEDWLTVPNAHPAIIKSDDFNSVQTILSTNTKPRSWSDSSPHLLSGLGRCGICGSRIIGMTFRDKNTGKIQYQYYRCLGRIQKGDSFCKGLSYKTSDLDEVIVSQVTGFEAASLKKQLQEYQREAKRQQGPLLQRKTELTTAFDEFSKKEARLVELYEDNIIDLDLYRQRRDQLDKQKLSIAAELTDIESRLPDENFRQLDARSVLEKFKSLQNTFHALDIHEKQKFLQAVVSEFRAFPDGRIELDLNLIEGLCDSKVPISQFQTIDMHEAVAL